MKRTTVCIFVSVGLFSGCVSISRDMPTTPEETIRRMKQIRILEVDLRQSEIMMTLRDFEALARYARKPFRLSAHNVEEEVTKSHKEWWAVRQPTGTSHQKGNVPNPWDPPNPKYITPVITFSARDISLYDTLTIICNISGLQWSIDRWNNVVITFRKEGQQPAAQLQSEGMPSD